MIKAIPLLLTLICPKTKVVNESGLPWNKTDERVFKSAVMKCKSDPMYASDTPCLGVFYKREIRAYAAICTYKRKVQ